MEQSVSVSSSGRPTTTLDPEKCPIAIPRDQNTQIQQGTDIAKQAVRQAIESEEIGNQILGDLAAQRETMQRSRANMGTVGKELDQSGGHIKEIEKPECCVM